MRRKIELVALAITLVLTVVPFAYAGNATGTIRLGPTVWPGMVASPADFEVWVEGAGDPTYDPHVLLVMTEDCWNGLTGDVVVNWTSVLEVSFNKMTNFTGVTSNSALVPPSGTESGVSYTVASLKDHLSWGLDPAISSTETIYWAMGAFLSGPLTGIPQDFTVTLPSTNPRMLVYALGKTEGADLLDNFIRRVPPTQPGFVIPEVPLGTIAAFLAMIGALGILAVKKKPRLAFSAKTPS
jgi:hypothetical protein